MQLRFEVQYLGVVGEIFMILRCCVRICCSCVQVSTRA